MKVTKRFELDAAHFLTKHYGACQYLHGHHYVFECTLEGHMSQASAEHVSTSDMLVDFSFLKAAFQETVGVWDHALLLPYKADEWEYLRETLGADTLRQLGLHNPDRVICLGFESTAENLADHAATELVVWLHAKCPRLILNRLHRLQLRIYETPTSWVDVEKIM